MRGTAPSSHARKAGDVDSVRRAFSSFDRRCKQGGLGQGSRGKRFFIVQQRVGMRRKVPVPEAGPRRAGSRRTCRSSSMWHVGSEQLALKPAASEIFAEPGHATAGDVTAVRWHVGRAAGSCHRGAQRSADLLAGIVTSRTGGMAAAASLHHHAPSGEARRSGCCHRDGRRMGPVGRQLAAELARQNWRRRGSTKREGPRSDVAAAIERSGVCHSSSDQEAQKPSRRIEVGGSSGRQQCRRRKGDAAQGVTGPSRARSPA